MGLTTCKVADDLGETPRECRAMTERHCGELRDVDVAAGPRAAQKSAANGRGVGSGDCACINTDLVGVTRGSWRIPRGSYVHRALRCTW